MCNCEDVPSRGSRREFLRGLGALVCASPLVGYATLAEAKSGSASYMLGDTEVSINIYGTSGGAIYFAPHSSETKCVDAALAVMARHGGRLVQIVNGGQRNISFSYKGNRYSFDPNRIFTDVGAKASLLALGHAYSAEVAILVREFRLWLLINIGSLRGKTLIALHNNTPGAYSLLSYAPGGDSSNDVVALHKSAAMSPDDFFFTTSRSVYDRLAAKDYNIALQSTSGLTDDGSMSVYCARSGIPYINVEAQPAHEAVQQAMIEALQGG